MYKYDKRCLECIGLVDLEMEWRNKKPEKSLLTIQKYKNYREALALAKKNQKKC